MSARVVDALLFLVSRSGLNLLRQKLRRLRQPKYALASLVGLAYLYFLLRPPGQESDRPGVSALDLLSGNELWLPLAACALLLVSLYAWMFPRDRAALRFSEAEVAFLLPAPVSRRSLIHYKLLRSQFGIVLAVLILSLVFRPADAGVAVTLMRATGWWLILSTVQLHFIAVSFARERLLAAGLGAWRRRLLAAAVLFVLAWQAQQFGDLPAPQPADLGNLRSFAGYLGRAIDQAGLLSYLLWPFRWLLAPYFAADGHSFLLALGPALAVLLAHYVWVLRADVAFEEASLAEASRHAQRMVALRSGQLRLGGQPLKSRSQPWRLAAHGPTVLAFLWKGLIESGPFYRLRTLLAGAAAIALTLALLSTLPTAELWLTVISVSCLVLAAMLYLLGPMFVLRSVQQLLQNLDLAKTYPLAGWQLVLGQLLTPLLLICTLQGVLLWTSGWALVLATSPPAWLGQFGAGALLAWLLLTPPLVGLLLCLPMAAALYFPAWVESIHQPAAGIERGGQQILFFAAYFIAIALALVPAGLLALLVFLPARLLLSDGSSLWLAAVAAAALLLVEFAGVVELLGRRLDRFDLAVELPR